MSNILAKSPYIVEVSATGLTGGKVEIFLWKQGSTISTLPQYTLSKLSPASNVTKVYFDVAPYVNEYISVRSFTIQIVRLVIWLYPLIITVMLR